MSSGWMQAVLALLIASLSACASDDGSVERSRVAGGFFACETQTGMTLLVASDGAYELRWGDRANERMTGWIEASGDQLRPLSGPLLGAVGRRKEDGILFSEPAGCPSFRMLSKSEARP